MALNCGWSTTRLDGYEPIARGHTAEYVRIVAKYFAAQ